MEPYKLGEMEGKLADLIWAHVPVSTRELVGLCAETFGWKRTTTYTMLRRLCERGIFAAREGRVTALLAREDFQAAQGEQFLNETFGGSLPRFLAAFTRRRALSGQEIREIQKLIEDYGSDSGEGAE